MKMPARPQLGWWAQLTLQLVLALVVWGNLDRLENPTGEKEVPLYGSGQADFSYTYLGARALLKGVNPYHNDDPAFTHPLFPPSDYAGFKQIYPPANLLLHVPLVLWKGADWPAAGRVWFRLSVLELAGLAVLVWALARRAADGAMNTLFIPLFFVCLACNTGTELALERGQSDILVALLAWGSVLCFLRQRYALCTFLSLWSVSIKGYAILLAGGMALLALDQRRWRAVLAGGVAAMLLFVLPVARYTVLAAQAVRSRSDMFWHAWFNHSFSNVMYTFAPALRERGRGVLFGLALATSVATWVEARRALTRRLRRQGALWMTAFATAALGAVVGYSSLSISYNLILILPGMLILVSAQRRLCLHLAIHRAMHRPLRAGVGAALAACAVLLFLYRGGGEGPPASGTGAPVAGFGLILLIALLGTFSLRALWVARRSATPSLLQGARSEGTDPT
jgi:hypothetical protein